MLPPALPQFRYGQVCAGTCPIQAAIRCHDVARRAASPSINASPWQPNHLICLIGLNGAHERELTKCRRTGSCQGRGFDEARLRPIFTPAVDRTVLRLGGSTWTPVTTGTQLTGSVGMVHGVPALGA